MSLGATVPGPGIAAGGDARGAVCRAPWPSRFLGGKAGGCLLGILLGVAGCETGARAWLGGSQAKGRMFQLAREKVLAIDAAAAPGCQERTVASIRVLDRPAAAATDYDRLYSAALPDMSRGLHTPSAQPSSASMVPVAFTERWIVERCGTRAAYRVRFSPGDIVEVFPEPQPRSSPKP